MIRYKKDGTWNSFGELIVDFPIEENKVKVVYSALGTGVWEIEDQNLVSMIDSIKVTNRNHPWLDQYFNMQEQFTLNERNSEQIMVWRMTTLTCNRHQVSPMNALKLRFN